MTVLTEGRHAGEFLISEANGQRSRETATVASGQDLPAGAIVEFLNGELIGFTGDTGAVAAGVLWDAVDASGGDVTGAVYIARDAEVNEAKVSVENDDTAESIKAAGIESLADIGIIAR